MRKCEYRDTGEEGKQVLEVVFGDIIGLIGAMCTIDGNLETEQHTGLGCELGNSLTGNLPLCLPKGRNT